MAGKKDFTATNRVRAAINEATAAQDAQETQETQGTQEHRRGRKPSGNKLQRINMAFYPEEYEYLQTMSRVMGLSMTDFCNDIIRQHMDKNKDNYKRAMDFRASLNSL